jgi:hypothetical protein
LGSKRPVKQADNLPNTPKPKIQPAPAPKKITPDWPIHGRASKRPGVCHVRMKVGGPVVRIDPDDGAFGRRSDQVSCDLCAGSEPKNWLIFDAARRRSAHGMRFIIKVALCGRCLELVLPRATPTDTPHVAQVPGREWPLWPARTRVS